MNMHQTLPEFRAGGTDLSERRRSGVSRGQIVDLTPTDTMTGIAWGQDGAARIGAMVTIETLASDARVRNAYRGPRRCRCQSSHATDPQRRDAGRKLGPTIAMLVLPQSASCLLEERRSGLPGPRRKSSLWSRVRPRTLRCTSSFDAGGRFARLRGYCHH